MAVDYSSPHGPVAGRRAAGSGLGRSARWRSPTPRDRGRGRWPSGWCWTGTRRGRRDQQVTQLLALTRESHSVGGSSASAKDAHGALCAKRCCVCAGQGASSGNAQVRRYDLATSASF